MLAWLCYVATRDYIADTSAHLLDYVSITCHILTDIEVFARRYWADLERRGLALQEQKLLRKVVSQSRDGSMVSPTEQEVHDAISTIAEVAEADVAGTGNGTAADSKED
jgi:hypothetical protein